MLHRLPESYICKCIAINVKIIEKSLTAHVRPTRCYCIKAASLLHLVRPLVCVHQMHVYVDFFSPLMAEYVLTQWRTQRVCQGVLAYPVGLNLTL